MRRRRSLELCQQLLIFCNPGRRKAGIAPSSLRCANHGGSGRKPRRKVAPRCDARVLQSRGRRQHQRAERRERSRWAIVYAHTGRHDAKKTRPPSRRPKGSAFSSQASTGGARARAPPRCTHARSLLGRTSIPRARPTRDTCAAGTRAHVVQDFAIYWCTRPCRARATSRYKPSDGAASPPRRPRGLSSQTSSSW